MMHEKSSRLFFTSPFFMYGSKYDIDNVFRIVEISLLSLNAMYNKLSSRSHTYSSILFDVFLFMPKYLFIAVYYNKPLHSRLIDRYKRLTAPTSKPKENIFLKNDAFLGSLLIILLLHI